MSVAHSTGLVLASLSRETIIAAVLLRTNARREQLTLKMAGSALLSAASLLPAADIETALRNKRLIAADRHWNSFAVLPTFRHRSLASDLGFGHDPGKWIPVFWKDDA